MFLEKQLGSTDMATKLPYHPSPGMVTKVLDKIIEAKMPDRFTVDFLGTKLGFKGGSARPIIPLLKRIGFLNDDGSPTDLYRKFRTERGRGEAMATALKQGYEELFSRNEYAQDLNRTDLRDLVYEITGAEKGNTTSESIVSTFFNLKDYADFEADSDSEQIAALPQTASLPGAEESLPREANRENGRTLNLGYTININLPETTDVEVYNAIFEAIERKLLK